MQNDFQSLSFLSLTGDALAREPQVLTTPIVLDLAVLHHIAGGASPNNNWGATTESPNNNWG